MNPIVKRLKHRVEARRDLARIWRYTLRVWGYDQADSYIDAIDSLARRLASSDVTGTPWNARYTRKRIGEHFIYYRESAAELTIIRVLHVRSDQKRHLPR